jgi:glucose-6-phosphate 1-dehydrogenase
MMVSAERLVILGAGGDLTSRYLLPAVAQLAEGRCLPPKLKIVGVAREDQGTEQFRRHVDEALALHAPQLAPESRAEVVERISYVPGDVTDPDVLARAVQGTAAPVLAYLALPPAVFPPAVSALSAAGLPEGSRVVVEKPFGTDLRSAQALNRLLHEHFQEESIFRMDHFLGKQTVQNILGVRFANRIFEPAWNRRHIERVEIIWDETVALEGRAGYYDHAGALVDMVQNHLLQLLCFIAMERPARLTERELRNAKVDLMRCVRRLSPAEVGTWTRRSRYRAGRVGDKDVPDYVNEPGVDPGNCTETFAAVTMFVENERWDGIPFVLRTGKAIGADRREILVTFRPSSQLVFGNGDEPPANRLVLQMDPDRMVLDLALNGRGDPFVLEREQLELELSPQELSPYARLLLDAFEGDPTMSIRGDEAEESWRVVEPILRAWQDGAAPMEEYPAGSTPSL